MLIYDAPLELRVQLALKERNISDWVAGLGDKIHRESKDSSEGASYISLGRRPR